MLTCAYPLRHFKGINLIARYKFTFRPKLPFATGKGIREKGLSDENRYFLKKQNEQIRKLRKYMKSLENQQKKLQGRLDKTSKMLHDIEETTEKLKKK